MFFDCAVMFLFALYFLWYFFAVFICRAFVGRFFRCVGVGVCGVGACGYSPSARRSAWDFFKYRGESEGANCPLLASAEAKEARFCGERLPS